MHLLKECNALNPQSSPMSDWEQVFNPCNTVWKEFNQQKQDALHVLFYCSEFFKKKGIQVIKQFVEHCEDNALPPKMDNVNNILEFIKYRVNLAEEKWTSQSSSRKSLREECALNALLTAIPHVNAVSKWQGYNIVCMQEEAIEVYRLKLQKAVLQARRNVQDYTGSSRYLTKRMHPEEYQNIVQSWWNGEASHVAAKTESGRHWAQVRGLMLQCTQAVLGRRGEDIRSIKLGMLFSHTLPNTQPVRNASLVSVSLRHVKECGDNVEHLLSWTRTKDRLACPLGALALYFVYLNDIEGPNIINIIKTDLQNVTNRWSDISLVQGKSSRDIFKEISYYTHNKTYHASFTASNINNKTAITHMDRNSLACNLIEQGMEINDVGMYQGWYHNTAADRYLRGATKTAPMLMAHGWVGGLKEYACWWDGIDTHIPKFLTQKVFVGLDETLTIAKDMQNSAVIEFLKCLSLLRSIFIEDAVHKQPQYPDFPVYARHPIFVRADAHAHTQWLEYCSQVESDIKKRQHTTETSAQRHLIDAIKIALQETGARESAVPITTGNMFCPPPNKDNAQQQIPEIKEPDDLYSAYGEWDSSMRSYFSTVVRPPWKSQFGALAQTMKLRFCKLRPYFVYLDGFGNHTDIRKAIDILDNIRKQHNVSCGVFIKQCFYSLTHKITESKRPPIDKEVLLAELKKNGLPLP